MDMMEVRRRVLLNSGKKVIDTSPKIAEYGKYLGRANGLINDDAEWCYTDWIYFSSDTPGRKINITDAFASLSRLASLGGDFTYQYENADGTFKDWFYGSNNFSEYTRTIGRTGAALYRIRWSLKIENINDCYAFCNDTGQILFAGKNSPYYGYININNMPA